MQIGESAHDVRKYCKSFLAATVVCKRFFLGVSESIVGMVLLCRYVVHSNNGSERLPSKVAQPSVYTVDAIVIGLTQQLV